MKFEVGATFYLAEAKSFSASVNLYRVTRRMHGTVDAECRMVNGSVVPKHVRIFSDFDLKDARGSKVEAIDAAHDSREKRIKQMVDGIQRLRDEQAFLTTLWNELDDADFR